MKISIRIVGSILLILVGMVGAVYGLLVYVNQVNNMQLCNSINGVYNQSKGNICNKIPDILTVGIVFELIGTFILLIGIILIVNVLRKRKKRDI